MPPANCFDASTLKDYLLGKLSDEQSDVVAAHLEACLKCEATVAELDRASDTLTDGLRLPAVAAEPTTDAELQKALDKVQSLEPAAEHRETSKASSDRSPLLRDYRLLEPLGSGGMGTVYKAVHTRLDRLVAVKLLPARRLGDEQAVARFQREMRVIGQLSHPAIVQATDAGEVDGTHFLVMEYVEGCDLNTLAKACGPLSVADACEIARQAALGLEYAHQQGIVHRDIKPSNLMLSFVVPPLGGASQSISQKQPPEGGTTNVKILDLGLALLSGVQAPVDELTTVGQLMGTLDYMAPEQLEDSHLVGPRADIYALAATLSRLLTGFAPFANQNRKTPLQKLRALATQAAPPIRERRADLPHDLAAIIDRALSRDPAERFVSMNEFAAAIAPWCAGHDLTQLVGHVVNVPGPAVELPSLWHQLGSHVRQNVGESQYGPRSGERGYGIKDTPIARSGHVENVPHGSSPRRTLLIALALLFLVASGIVITIETNKGTLIVESLRDGVEVRVKKSGKSVEHLELTTGPKSARLAAGEYEIEIVGNADGLQIQNGKFVLKRGDTVVAKITEKPHAVVDMAGAVDKAKLPEPPAESRSRKPVEIVDRDAKGMETFEASNPDLAGEKKVRDVLQKNIKVEFAELPLVDVLRFLEERTQIVFFLETAALDEEGIAQDTPITLSLKDKPTTTVLEFLLRPIQCAWYIDGGQVVITSAAREMDVFVTRTYPVGKLLPGVRQAVERLKSEPLQAPPNSGRGGGGFGGGFFHVSGTSQLVGTLPLVFGQVGGAAPAANPPQDQPVVIPTEANHFQELLSESLGHAWIDYGGEGGTCELLHNVLVVRHTRRAHADVESLLRTVEAAFLKPLAEPVEIRPAGYSLEADANVRRQLARKLDVAFTETPLTDVAMWLSDQLEVQVLIDREALEGEGIPVDTPVTLQFHGIAGDVLLSRMLKPLLLAYDIEHGLLVFTTMQKLRDRLVTKVYDVRDLLDRGLHPSRLIAGLQTTTPGPWSEEDGNGGTLSLFADTLLVVRQTWHNHDEVAKFLTSLRSQLSDQPEIPRVVKADLKSTTPDSSSTSRPNQPQPKGPTASNNPPTKSASDSQPRYDGKSFDEWLAVLEVERSPARLADAIEALRLLGRDTQAALIAERVLKTARVSDFKFNNRPFIEFVDLLGSLPAAIVQRACANELRNGTVRSRKFLINHAEFMRIEKPVADELLAAMCEVCRDNDPAIRQVAVGNLQWLVGVTNNVRFAEQRMAILRVALKDLVAEIAMSAAEQLRDVESESKVVAEALARIVEKPDHVNQRMIALNQLAVMGPRAASVAPQVAAVLLEPLSDDEPSISNEFGAWLRPFRIEWVNAFHYVAAVALARMGNAAAAELPTIQKAFAAACEEYFEANAAEFPTIQKALDNPDAMKGYDGRNWFADVNRVAHWQDLLMAVKSRLTEPATLDIRGGNMNAIGSVNRVLEGSYQLLKMEAALLQQFRPKDPGIPPLLDRCEAIKHDAELVNQLLSVRQSVESPIGTPSEIAASLVKTMQQQHQGRNLWRDERPTETSTGTRILADSPRESAINELGKLGPAARDALPLLKKELESKNKSVAAAAEKAIKQIEAAKDDQKIE